MCNFSIHFNRPGGGSTNIIIKDTRLTKFIDDNRYSTLECEFIDKLAKNFIFDISTHILTESISNSLFIVALKLKFEEHCNFVCSNTLQEKS